MGDKKEESFQTENFHSKAVFGGYILKWKSAKKTKWLGTDNTGTYSVQEKDQEIFKSSFEIRRCTSSLGLCHIKKKF